MTLAELLAGIKQRLANAEINEAVVVGMKPTDLGRLVQALEVADAALAKIEDPRLRDHKEPDAYTAHGCVMNMAEMARAEIARILGGE